MQARLNESIETLKKRYVSPFGVAENYMLLGDQEQALVWLGKAVEDRDDSLTFVGVDPVMDGLRQDPRFKKLVQRVGLPE